MTDPTPACLPAMEGRFFDLAPGPAVVTQSRVEAPLLLGGRVTEYHLRVVRTSMAASVVQRMSRLELDAAGDLRFRVFNRETFKFDAAALRGHAPPEALPASAWSLGLALLADTRAAVGFDGWGDEAEFWRAVGLAVDCAAPHAGRLACSLATRALSAEIAWSSAAAAGSPPGVATPELLRLTEALLALFSPRGAQATVSQHGALSIVPFRLLKRFDPVESAHGAMAARGRLLAWADGLPNIHRAAIRGILTDGELR